MGLSIEHSKKLTRHSILTAVAMDTVGFALAGRKTEIDGWLSGAKSTFPRHADRKKTGLGSSNSVFLYEVVEQLAEFNPIEYEDIFEFVGEIQPPKTKNPARLLPLGMGIAYYSALAELPRFVMVALLDAVLDSCGFTSQEKMPSRALCHVLSRLYTTGWFGWASMQELLEYEIIEGRFRSSIKTLMENNLDANYLSQPFSVAMCEDLSYQESVLLQAFYYMTRVDTAYPPEIMKSLPRAQIPEILQTKVCNPADVAFVFGGICTLSEGGVHPLVTKHLRENIHNIVGWDRALSYIS